MVPRSPWQYGHSEWLTGSIPRESLDYVVVPSEAHLRRLLRGLRRQLQSRQDASHSLERRPVDRHARAI